MNNKDIESVVSGRIHGTDVSAGFEKGWVEMVDLNQQVAAPGTQKAMKKSTNKENVKLKRIIDRIYSSVLIRSIGQNPINPVD